MGLGAAKLAAEAGTCVPLVGRTEARASSVAAGLGPSAKAFSIDVSDTESVAGFFARVGSFDHLSHSSGNQTNTSRFHTM